jgi:predicted nucleic acid-binding protein
LTVFVDTWAWLAIGSHRDPYHAAAIREYARLRAGGALLISSDYVLTETITQAFTETGSKGASAFVTHLLHALKTNPRYRLEYVSPARFERAWQMRLKYADKPGISFVDLTSMVIMQDLGIADVFTGDRHFEQVGLGFRLHPQTV